jgi:hypothetical protein
MDTILILENVSSVTQNAQDVQDPQPLNVNDAHLEII